MTIKVITVGEKVLVANEVKARENKNRLDKQRILTINIMSSPGAGKTSLILSTIKHMRAKAKIAVIEGDVASSVDAEKVNAVGIPVIQINTAGGCHLDANMVAQALDGHLFYLDAFHIAFAPGYYFHVGLTAIGTGPVMVGG